MSVRPRCVNRHVPVIVTPKSAPGLDGGTRTGAVMQEPDIGRVTEVAETAATGTVSEATRATAAIENRRCMGVPPWSRPTLSAMSKGCSSSLTRR